MPACSLPPASPRSFIAVVCSNMAAHTGLTPAVLSYKAPNALIPEFEVQADRANFADPNKSSLLSAATKVDELTPWIGTQLHGLQLSQLSDAQKDELALLVAEVGSMDLIYRITHS